MGHAIVIEVDVYCLTQSGDLNFPVVLGTIPENKTEKDCENHKKEDAEYSKRCFHQLSCVLETVKIRIKNKKVEVKFFAWLG